MTADAVGSDLEASFRAFRDVVADLRDEEWDLPSQCPGWTVRDVVAHVVTFEEMLAGATTPDVDIDDSHVRNDIGRLNEQWVTATRGVDTDELIARLDDVVQRRVDEVAGLTEERVQEEGWSPVGTVPYARFLQVRVLDTWFHEQDVREAVGRPGGDGGSVPERALSEVVLAIGYAVSKLGGAPEGSSVRFELTPVGGHDPLAAFDVVVDGRARVAEDPVPAPTATIAADVAAFSRLVGGRGEPGDLIDAGRVVVSGDVELGDRVARHLGYMI